MTITTGTHIKATEVKILNTYKDGNNEFALINHEGRGYIGWKTDFHFTADYELIRYEEAHFDIIDDDASHLHLDDFEGIFEMRCDDFVMELASLAG